MAERYDDAIADLTRAIEKYQGNVRPYIIRGNCYRSLNMFDMALADYSRVIELAPTIAEPLFQRATLRFEMKKFQEAADDLTRAIELDPSPRFHIKRAECWTKLEKLDRAAADRKAAESLK